MRIGIKRTFDVISAFGMLVLLGLPMVFVALAVKLTSPGPVIYRSRRIGKDNVEFLMPKFRTMRVGAPQLATHLMMLESHKWFTPIGAWLRKTSLDELPQIWSVVKGDMGIVGPRPALYNQFDLIDLRTRCGVHTLVPGITGWAQVHGRDNLAIPNKVALDEHYLRNRSIKLDVHVILITAIKALRGDDVVDSKTLLVPQSTDIVGSTQSASCERMVA